MDDESAKTIVDLLMRIESKLDRLLDPSRRAAEGAAGGAFLERRTGQAPIEHPERRTLMGDL